MNIQEMLSKMSPQMLQQGLEQISRGLSPEQLKQAESVIKGSGAAMGVDKKDGEVLQQLLKSNPQQLKELVSNKELVAKLQEIVKKK